MIATKFVLLIFTINAYGEPHYIAAKMQMQAYECLKEAQAINLKGEKKYAACMPVESLDTAGLDR